MIKVIEMTTAQDFEAALYHELSQGFGLVQCFVTPSWELNSDGTTYTTCTLYTAVLIKQTQVSSAVDRQKTFWDVKEKIL